MSVIYRVTHTYPNGDTSVFLVEKGAWERWKAWRATLAERLAKKEAR